MAEKSGWSLKGVSTRYCVLLGSFPEASLEQIPVALVMAMNAAFPGTPFALKEMTPADASRGVSELPRTVPENVAVPGVLDEEPPPHEASRAAEAKNTATRMEFPLQRILPRRGARTEARQPCWAVRRACRSPWMRKATSDGPERSIHCLSSERAGSNEIGPPESEVSNGAGLVNHCSTRRSDPSPLETNARHHGSEESGSRSGPARSSDPAT